MLKKYYLRRVREGAYSADKKLAPIVRCRHRGPRYWVHGLHLIDDLMCPLGVHGYPVIVRLSEKIGDVRFVFLGDGCKS